jgi:DNA-binding NarL/FixJ family response regulator
MKTLPSKREKEVLNIVAKGKSNKEAGKELFITERTVKSHLRSISIKYDIPVFLSNANKRVALVCKAIAMGDIKNPYLTRKEG